MDEHLSANQKLKLIQQIKALSSPMNPKPTDMATKLTSLPGIRAVLFDVYGTLFISGSGDIGVAKTQYNQRSFHEALAIFGIVTSDYHSEVQGRAC